MEAPTSPNPPTNICFGIDNAISPAPDSQEHKPPAIAPDMAPLNAPSSNPSKKISLRWY